jgi:uncharacterized protein (TIGR03067 family)
MFCVADKAQGENAALVIVRPAWAQADKDAEAEVERLKGTWKVVAAETMGKKSTPEEMGIDQIIFKDKNITIKRDGKDVMMLAFTVAPEQKPKAMDWINLKQKGAPPLPGIYELNENELRICFPMLPRKGTDPATLKKLLLESRRRPMSFATEGRAVFVLVAQRQ